MMNMEGPPIGDGFICGKLATGQRKYPNFICRQNIVQKGQTDAGKLTAKLYKRLLGTVQIASRLSFLGSCSPPLPTYSGTHLPPERGMAEHLAPWTAPARCGGDCAFLLASTSGTALRAEWESRESGCSRQGGTGTRGPASDARTRSPPPIREPLAAGSAPDRLVHRSSVQRNATTFLQLSGRGWSGQRVVSRLPELAGPSWQRK
ncbi:secretory carrier-associated membrane protein 5 isoform X2 [Rattus norvegicus]|uniref:secretory carrier-associated membrane protein 5 isoform X2 n=1 Tax=Rattus norvegicus TaxID=10116 RepID=UPI002FD875D0